MCTPSLNHALLDRDRCSNALRPESDPVIVEKTDNASRLGEEGRGADVGFTKGTLPELQAAKAYLEKAGSYASMDYQREILGKRQAVVDSMIATLQAQ